MIRKFRRFMHDILPQSLFGRTLVIMVTPVLLLQVATTIVFFDRHWSKMTDRLAFSVAGEIASIAEQIEDQAGDNKAIQAIQAQTVRHLEMVTDYQAKAQRQKEWSVTRKGPGVEATLARAMDEQVHRPFDIDLYPDFKRVEITVQLDDGILHISVPERRLFSSSSYIFILWMIGLSILFFAISILFMRNQIRPIRRLSIAAERLGKGRDVPNLKPSGAREVRQAGEAFIRMRNRIGRQIQQRTAMLAGVSHDLRTPLTRLRLQLEMLGDNPDTDAMRQDLNDMEAMINGYLAFARGDGDEVMEVTDLNELLERVVSNARRQGHQVELRSEEAHIALPIKPQAMERSLTNIVGNACKYATMTYVQLVRSEDGEKILFVIDDNGPGIAAELYEEVFKPFYRVDESRNSKSGGVGLGLSIAQDVVISHGGTIKLQTSPAGGLRVVISLPI